jgi:hypothetical protein
MHLRFRQVRTKRAFNCCNSQVSVNKAVPAFSPQRFTAVVLSRGLVSGFGAQISLEQV